MVNVDMRETFESSQTDQQASSLMVNYLWLLFLRSCLFISAFVLFCFDFYFAGHLLLSTEKQPLHVCVFGIVFVVYANFMGSHKNETQKKMKLCRSTLYTNRLA